MTRTNELASDGDPLDVADLKLLQAGASELGVELSREQLSAFSLYMNEMLRWNQRANLTAITAPDEIQAKHFLDSLTCLLAFPAGEPVPEPAAMARDGHLDLTRRLDCGANLSILDIGTGAGFPGLPLKISLPKAKVTLVDSIGKKTAFLTHMLKLLKMEDVRVLTSRAEDLARDRSERESYDLVVVRAVSRVAVLAELCLPLCKIGGSVVALKKGDLGAEIEEGRYAVETMGGRYGPRVSVAVSLLEEGRELVTMEKVGPTPSHYPRRPGMPAKRPLVKD